MGTVSKYTTPGGREGYLVRDSWQDAHGERKQTKARFPADKHGGLKAARREADAWLAQREADRSRGVIWEPSRETLGAALDRWASGLGPPLAGHTIISYRNAVRFRFDDKARALVVGRMTAGDVRRIVDGWHRAGVSGGTSQAGWIALKRVMKMLLEEEGLRVDPTAGMTAPGRGQIADAVWTPAQVRAFLDSTASHELGYAWALMFATCCRIGELCAMRWDDVDWTGGRVMIRRTMGRSADGVQIVQTTTKTGRVRSVPVPAGVLALLDRVRMSRTFDDGGWIVSKYGQAMNTNTMRGQWRRAVRDSGLPAISPHGARHSGATNMIAAGVSVAVVARILGHTDPAMTLRRYVHPDRADAVAAVEALDALYSGGQTGSNVVPLKKKA